MVAWEDFALYKFNCSWIAVFSLVTHLFVKKLCPKKVIRTREGLCIPSLTYIYLPEGSQCPQPTALNSFHFKMSVILSQVLCVLYQGPMCPQSIHSLNQSWTALACLPCIGNHISLKSFTMLTIWTIESLL